MRHNFKSRIIMLAVLILTSTVCYADPPSFLDWRSSDFMFAKNCAAEISGKGDCVCGNAEGKCGGCSFKKGNPCYRSRAAKSDESITLQKKSLDMGDVHTYLGYTTVLLVGLAAATAGDNGAHYGTAYGSAVAAAGTVATGFLEYGDRFDLGNGLFSEDNAHIILGTLGAIACIAAVAVADSDGGGGHAGAGGAGGGAMALSIVTIKW